MTEHLWGCEVDRNQQYGEPVNPICSCAIDERSRLEYRITELEAIWESQAAVIRRHHATIEEQLGFIRQQSTRIGEIAASNFGLRKSRDKARAAVKANPEAPEDQRITAWNKIVGHPFFKPAFNQDAPLIDSMIDLLDGLVVAERRNASGGDS